jgi:hypothetical protein
MAGGRVFATDLHGFTQITLSALSVSIRLDPWQMFFQGGLSVRAPRDGQVL